MPGDGPHRAIAIGSCHAQPVGLGVEPGHGLTLASYWHDPQTFVLCRARAGPKTSCFRPAH
jgi:hypothetical protein